MIKNITLLLLGVISLVIVGCGQVAQQTGGDDNVSAQSQIQSNVLASSKITISMGQGSGVGISSIETDLVASQSVDIEASVPDFMTFDAQSSIFFNVDHLGMIAADGVITLNVEYNDLLAATLQDVRVRAYMLSGDGLTGQTRAQIIPLDIELVTQKPYTALTETKTDMKQWSQPFDQAINETLVFKLRGDFSYALNQLYKGTLVLDFVRNDEINLEDGLVAYYPFNGNANDESVHTNNAVVDGAILSADRSGNPLSVYSFDGVDDSIVIPASSQCDFGVSNFSMTFWFRSDKPGGYIVDERFGDERGYVFSLTNTGNLGFGLKESDAVGKYIYSENSYSDNQWHLVAGVRDQEGIKLYVDNQLVAAEVCDSFDIGNSNSINIGTRFVPWSANYFRGSLDSLRIYNRALNKYEIDSIYTIN